MANFASDEIVSTPAAFAVGRFFDGAAGDATPIIPGLWLFVAALGSLIVVTLLVLEARLVVDLGNPVALLLMLFGALGIVLRWQLRRPASNVQRIARDGAEFLGLFILVCLLGTLASYAIAKGSVGYVDARLEHMDRLLGFNWIAWYEAVSNHDVLQVLGRTAYGSIVVTPIVILVCHALRGNVAQARRFIATYWVAAIITLIAFHYVPAKGALAFLWHGHIPYMPVSGLYQGEVIDALRAHATNRINLSELRGLVCSPSFHTTSAILFIAAGWRLGGLRWPILLLNLAMLTATPVEGTHYLVDMIGGALVAVVALALMAVAMDALWRARGASALARGGEDSLSPAG